MNNHKKIILGIIIILVLQSHATYSQYITRPDIQYVSLQDTFLIQVLDSLIQYEEVKDSLFAKGYGYFMVFLSQPMSYGTVLEDNTRIDTVFQYHIQINYMHPDQCINGFDDLYPSYYSLIGDRVVNLANDNFIGKHLNYSEGSKQIYTKILEKNLASKDHPSLKYFRIGEAIYIYYLQNRFTSKYEKPVIVRKVHK